MSSIGSFAVERTLVLAALVLPTSLASAQTCNTSAFPNGLAPPSLDANSKYGSALDVTGTRALVGAPDEDGGKGAVFLHEFNGSTWTAGLRLQPNDLVALDHFGAGVAIDGDWALVGAPDDDQLGVDAGAVYVYRRIFLIGTFVWVQSAKIFATDTVAGDRFGAAVAMQNGRAVIGAPNDNIVYFHQGSAYAFELSGSTWSQISKLTAGGSQVNENFGSTVAIAGDFAAVGGPNWDSVTPSKIDSGRAAVFARITSPSVGWFLDAAIVPADAVTSQRFGTSVTLDGTRLLVGATGALNLGGIATGACHVYESIGIGAWQQKAKLLSSGGVLGDLLGSGVALTGTHAFVAGKDKVIPYDLIANAWTEKAQLEVPFAAFLAGPAAKPGPVLATTSAQLFVGRPSIGAGDVGIAFPFAVCGGSWTNLAGATLGSGGIPKLRGAGGLDDGLPLELRLKFGKPLASGLFLTHLGAAGNLPFFGGVLHAFPIDLSIAITLDATGSLVLPAILPAGLANQSLVMQVLVADPIANGDVALSNGVVATIAP